MAMHAGRPYSSSALHTLSRGIPVPHPLALVMARWAAEGIEARIEIVFGASQNSVVEVRFSPVRTRVLSRTLGPVQ